LYLYLIMRIEHYYHQPILLKKLLSSKDKDAKEIVLKEVIFSLRNRSNVSFSDSEMNIFYLEIKEYHTSEEPTVENESTLLLAGDILDIIEHGY